MSKSDALRLPECLRHILEAIEHDYLPLGFAYEMRNALAHGYFKVDLAIVWKTIHASLPELHAQIKQLLEEIGQLGNICRSGPCPRPHFAGTRMGYAVVVLGLRPDNTRSKARSYFVLVRIRICIVVASPTSMRSYSAIT